jgi:AraC family transcriptional regulator
VKEQKVLFIQNMVCPRCVRVVKEDLEKLGVEVQYVELGKAEVRFEPEVITPARIRSVLQQSGFEMLEDKESRLIEQIKVKLIELIDQEDRKLNTSEYLSRELGMNYSQLSKLFSRHEGLTIEKFFIQLKIQKVKELLKYDQLSLEQIAFRLDYSSPAHLSRQFKASTGMTASEFRKKILAEKE